MIKYHVTWTRTDHWEANVTSAELATALGMTVAEIEATDPADFGSWDLENGLAEIEDNGDDSYTDRCERSDIDVTEQATEVDARRECAASRVVE